MRIITKEEKVIAKAGIKENSFQKNIPVKVGTNFIESTNGVILARCESTEPAQLAEDYPSVPTTENDQHVPGEDIFVLPEDLIAHKTFKSSNLPILDNTTALTIEKDGVTRMTSTDLSQTSTTESHVDIGEHMYPDTDSLWPDITDGVEVTLSARYLKLIVDMIAGQTSKKEMESTGVTFKVTNWDRPVTFKWKADSYSVKGLLMPMHPDKG